MPALIKAHAHDRVAERDKRGVGGEVGVRTAVGLHVGESGAVELASAVARKVLHDVHLLAAAVVALAGIPFGVLVREHAAHCLHHGEGREILRRDKLDAAALTIQLLAQHAGHCGIDLRKVGQRHGDKPFLKMRFPVFAYASTIRPCKIAIALKTHLDPARGECDEYGEHGSATARQRHRPTEAPPAP